MQTRRLIAAGAVVVIVIAMALLIHSCSASATTDALKNYNAAAYQLASGSTANARRALRDLASGKLNSITQDLTGIEQNARADLAHAQRLQVPSQMGAAQSSLVNVLSLRQRGLLLIANYAQQAASKATSKNAIYEISLGTSLLYASDVLYKTFTGPDLASALHHAGIPVGGGSGQPIYGGQIVPDLGWLNTTWIADKIGAQLSTAQANINNEQPNLQHGDALTSVNVAGVTLSPTGNNNVVASLAGNWALGVINTGQTPENDVGCSVTIRGTGIHASSMIPTIPTGGTATCTVVLPTRPPTGAPYTVVAKVDKVPLEKNLSNNTYSYTVTFS